MKKGKEVFSYNKHPPKKQPKKLRVKVSSSKTLEEELNEVYNLHGDLATTCLRQCNCCNVACPQMNYSEAVSIIDDIWKNWSKEDKTKILVTAIKYFFSKSLIKPCPMLKEKDCSEYAKRCLSCRIYGLWPKEVYDKRAESVSKNLGLPKEQVPLNTQCEFVKRINGQPISIEQINEMYDKLDKIDLHLLIGNNLTIKEDIEHKIGTRWNYRTMHDWLLFLFLGEDWLTHITQFSLAAKKEDLEDLLTCWKKLLFRNCWRRKLYEKNKSRRRKNGRVGQPAQLPCSWNAYY